MSWTYWPAPANTSLQLYLAQVEILDGIRERLAICHGNLGIGATRAPYSTFIWQSGTITDIFDGGDGTIAFYTEDDNGDPIDWLAKFTEWASPPVNDYAPTSFKIAVFPKDDPDATGLGDPSLGLVNFIIDYDSTYVSSPGGPVLDTSFIKINNDGRWTLNGLSLGDYGSGTWGFHILRAGAGAGRGYDWTELYPAYPNDPEYDYGVTSSATTTSITDNRDATSLAFQCPKPWPDKLKNSAGVWRDVCYQIDNSAKWARAQITGYTPNTAGEPTIQFATQADTPAGGYWIVDHGAWWRPQFAMSLEKVTGRTGTFWTPANINNPPWGTTLSSPAACFLPYWTSVYTDQAILSHEPATDTLLSAPKFVETISLEFDLGGLTDFPVFDNYGLTAVDATPFEDHMYCPWLAWSMRGYQIIADSLTGGASWVEAKDYTGLTAIPVLTNATRAKLFAPDNTRTVTISAVTEPNATIAITMPYATPAQQYTVLDCEWTVFDANGDVKKSGSGTVTATELTDDGSGFDDDPTNGDIGLTVVISFGKDLSEDGDPVGGTGRTRLYERRVMYLYPRIKFIPDVKSEEDGGGLAVPPTGSGAGDSEAFYRVIATIAGTPTTYDYYYDVGLGYWVHAATGDGFGIVAGVGYIQMVSNSIEWSQNPAGGSPSTNIADYSLDYGAEVEPTLTSITYFAAVTGGYPGSYVVNGPSTNYAEYNKLGVLTEDGHAFITGESARYVADNFRDPTTGLSDNTDNIADWWDIGYQGRPNVTSESNFPRWEGSTRTGTVTDAGAYTGGGWIADAAQQWELSATPLVSYTGTSTGNTTTVSSDMWDDGDGPFSPASDARFTASSRLENLLPIIEASNDSGVTWEPRPSTVYAGGTFTCPAFSFDTNGKPVRFSEPGYIDAARHGCLAHVWKGKKLVITSPSGQVSPKLDIFASDQRGSFFSRVFYTGDPGFAVVAGCTYAIDVIEPGAVVQRYPGNVEAHNGFVRPEYAVPDDRGEDWHLGRTGVFENNAFNLPTIVTAFGLFRSGDISQSPDYWQQLYKSVDVLRWIKAAPTYSDTADGYRVSGTFSGDVEDPVIADMKALVEAGWDAATNGTGSGPPFAWASIQFHPGDVSIAEMQRSASTLTVAIPTQQLAHQSEMWLKGGIDSIDEPEGPKLADSSITLYFDANGTGMVYRAFGKSNVSAVSNSASDSVVVGGPVPITSGNKPNWPSDPGDQETHFAGCYAIDKTAIIKFDVANGLTYVTPGTV